MKTTFAVVLCFVGTLSLYGQSVSVKSPDANLEFIFSVDSAANEQGSLFYSLSYKSGNIVLKSRLGILNVDLP